MFTSDEGTSQPTLGYEHNFSHFHSLCPNSACPGNSLNDAKLLNLTVSKRDLHGGAKLGSSDVNRHKGN